MRRFLNLLFFGCLIALAGCVGLKEGMKGFAGVSTKVLEDTRPRAVKKTFNFDGETCYEKVQEALSTIGAYIYAQPADRSMIAIYISRENTTPVGLFFTKIDPDHTQIEVSSPSTYGKELIANKVFAALGKKNATVRSQ